jgi:hypothetical protein
MAQAIQHKGETVAKLREGEEWVVVGTKIVIFKPSNPTYSREISTIGAYYAPLLAGQTGMILTLWVPSATRPMPLTMGRCGRPASLSACRHRALKSS